MIEKTNQRKYKYDAFISYRHTELDKFVAEKVQKYLEEFKLPKKLKKIYKLEKTKINRVFRDKEELTITNNLEDPIIQALKDSEYLIVICSPRIKESIWCLKEIEKFIEFHGRNKILTVLIEGEPNESFPELLLHEDVIVEENGVSSIQHKEVEPLAADVRGNSKRQICALLKSELLRVIAAMFRLEYDDLRQRHRERRFKKILTTTICVAALGIAIGVAGIASALIINSQKEKLLNNQADNLAKESLQYFEQDRRMDALKSAYYSVTEYEGIKMPYTPNGEFALTQTLRIYDAGGIYKANKQLNASANIFNIELSPSRKYTMSFDMSAKVNLWDLTSGKLMIKLDDVYMLGASDVLATFIDDSKIAYLSNDKKVKVIDFIKQKDLFDVDNTEDILSITGNDTGKYVAIVWQNKIEVYDILTGKKIYIAETQEGTNFDSDISWDGEKLLYVEKKSSKSTLKIIDINSKDSTEFSGDFNRLVDAKSNEEYIFLLTEGFDSVGGENFSSIIAFNNTTCTVEWETTYENIKFYEINIIENKEDQIILVNAYDYIINFDPRTGIDMTTQKITEGIADLYINSEEFVQIINTEGKLMRYYAFSGELYDMDFIIDYNINEINQMKTCQEGFLLLPSSSNYLIKYENVNNKDKKKFEGNVDELLLKSTPDEEKTIEIDNSELINKILYTEDKKIAFITYLDMSMSIYDVVNKKIINSINKVDSPPFRIFGKDKNGNVYIASDSHGYCFDKDYNLIWEIDDLLYVDVEKGSLLIRDSENVCWEFPIYSLEELLEKAEKEIE